MSVNRFNSFLTAVMKEYVSHVTQGVVKEPQRSRFWLHRDDLTDLNVLQGQREIYCCCRFFFLPVHSKLWGRFEVVHQLVGKSNDSFLPHRQWDTIWRDQFLERSLQAVMTPCCGRLLGVKLPLGSLEVGLNDTQPSFFYGVSLCLATSKG